jgi:hypothetical protein
MVSRIDSAGRCSRTGGRDVAEHVLGGAACKAPFAAFRACAHDVYQMRPDVGLDARPVTITAPHIPVSPIMLRATRRLSAGAGDRLPQRAVADGGW